MGASVLQEGRPEGLEEDEDGSGRRLGRGEAAGPGEHGGGRTPAPSHRGVERTCAETGDRFFAVSSGKHKIPQYPRGPLLLQRQAGRCISERRRAHIIICKQKGTFLVPWVPAASPARVPCPPPRVQQYGVARHFQMRGVASCPCVFARAISYDWIARLINSDETGACVYLPNLMRCRCL